jgi:preprotein translocase subunit SecF
MEIFRNTNYDFLGKKRPFIIVSLVLATAGMVSLVMKGGPRYGIDFRGGTVMDVKFEGRPPVEKIRSVLSSKISGEITVQGVGGTGNEVLIGTELKTDQELATARQTMIETLESTFGQPGTGKVDFNNIGSQNLAGLLRDPLTRSGVPLSDPQLLDLAQRMLAYRDQDRSGLVRNFQELSAVQGVTPAVIQALEQQCYLAPFNVKSVDIVGPKVGSELRKQALLATLYALGGMLVYIAFRFEWIYGVAAVIAVFHDTFITLGLFSIFNKEISLTVIAALLTLVGYSMNDTIVVFDRIRENLKILRREKLESLINKSINQTLSRTILTSGLTFLTVLSLFLFGGEVLHGFAFALVVGIIVGTYSSIFIASPIVVFWQGLSEKRKKRPSTPPPPPVAQSARKGTVKAAK